MTNPRFLCAVLLVVLSGIPAAAGVCAALCQPPAGVSGNERLAQPDHAGCHKTAQRTAVRITSAADDHCGTHDTAVREVIVTPAARITVAVNFADALETASIDAPALIHRSFLEDTGSSPRGRSSGTTTLLVLRV